MVEFEVPVEFEVCRVQVGGGGVSLVYRHLAVVSRLRSKVSSRCPTAATSGKSLGVGLCIG